MKRGVQMPKFARTFVADLRERHLLVPIIALIVAIAAVPFLLGGGSSEPTGPAPLPVAGADASELDSAVLTENPGVRNYRTRLAALRKKNPFDQKFEIDPESDTVAVSDGAVGDPSVSVDGGTSTSSASASSSVAPGDAASVAPTTTPAGEPSSVAPSSSGGDSGATKPAEPQKPVVRYYAGRIDVRMGTAGSLKDYEGVRYLEFLPSAREPVVTFVGLAHDGERAVFAVSREVTDTDGDGSCAPKRPAPCQLVRLAVGEERTFTYGASGPTYHLKLLDARIVRVQKPGD